MDAVGVSGGVDTRGQIQHGIKWLLVLIIQFQLVAFSAEEISVPIGRKFSVRDTIGQPHDESADAAECLAGLCWPAEQFTAKCVATETEAVTSTIRFPSAIKTGNKQSDQVALEWYAVHNETGLKTAPAIVVVHESGSSMTVGRMVARGLRDRGLHAFMIHLPYYGLRRPPGRKPEHADFGDVMKQGIADVRRARDVVAMIPAIESGRVSLQGTSLGGFVSSTTAGLDSAFDKVFILLAGGDLDSLVINGQREAGELRELLNRQGYEGDALQSLLYRFEPNRLAHRIPAGRLWLYTALYDTVVPKKHGYSFADAASLPQGSSHPDASQPLFRSCLFASRTGPNRRKCSG